MPRGDLVAFGRRVFEQEYLHAFKGTQHVILSQVEGREIDAGEDLLDVNILADKILKTGVDCLALADAGAIRQFFAERSQSRGNNPNNI